MSAPTKYLVGADKVKSRKNVREVRTYVVAEAVGPVDEDLVLLEAFVAALVDFLVERSKSVNLEVLTFLLSHVFLLHLQVQADDVVDQVLLRTVPREDFVV